MYDHLPSILKWSICLGVVFWCIHQNSILFVLTFICGIILLCFFMVYYTTKVQLSRSSSIKRQHRRFNFTLSKNWTQEITQLQNEQLDVKRPIFSDSFLVSESLQGFIDLIIQEFITPWYTQITQSTQVQTDISLELKEVIRNLQNRARSIDFAQLLVSDILPLIQEHFENYLRAEDIVKSQGKFSKFDSNEYHMAVACQFRRGKLHPAVTTSLVVNEETNFKEKQYLRKKMKTVLELVLSENEKSNDVGLSLVTEILACTVLCNVINLLTESDFYNLIIVKLIGDNLRRRDQVKQLRAALQEHTQKSSKEISDNQMSDMTSALLTPDSNLQNQLKLKINERKQQREKQENLNLKDILTDKTNFQVFKEFMESEGRSKLVEFWKAVEVIKAPLEGEENDDETDPLALSLEFGNNDDVYNIYIKFIKTNEIPQPDTHILQVLSSSGNNANVRTYQEARMHLFKMQRDYFDQMQSHDLPVFIKSDMYLRLVNRKESSDVNPEVINAVENAFTLIMNKPESLDTRLDASDEFNSDQLLTTLQLKTDLFGDSSTNLSDGNHSNRNSRLFDDFLSDEEQSDSDRDSLYSDKHSQSLNNSNSEVQFAAPGNLNLAEEIPKLSDEVDNLQKQITILEPLLRKAELTNNLSELKVLQKSKIGLIREINVKELQKQQFIVQENDNSLFGKSRVCIQSYINDNEKNGREFTLYIIEVQKFSNENPTIIKAGWVVARRFSQFYGLHEYLKLKYPRVSYLKFPKKSISVLKFQQKQVAEIRMKQLEDYLQELIKIQEVCSDRAFRSFLSSENFNLKKNQRFEETRAKNYSDTNFQTLFGSKWYRGLSNFMTTTKNDDNHKDSTYIDTHIMENLRDMESELKQFDEAASAKTPFVKPICDLLISVFKLHYSRSWLRGRALVVILQQILGTTVEKKVYDVVEGRLKTEENVLDLIMMLTNILFPNGKFKDPPVIRSLYQQANTRQEAKVLSEIFIFETCSTIFGRHNSIFASTKIFSMIQNEYLNRNLVFEIVDEILEHMFAEMK
ncbi:structural protein mdm1 homologue, putative [Candida dubliniensis CD36]|uniref:Structural protein mdm1 homologue, putative n=1 Tax=Candida dubliniensis (strain CD36 / ATCC MYA-646 / CBS 7987 / NCPF 3949 / NRRL Y-17841) TaxID=573826 RepID=B9WKZ9_CANDC|nr:structural protein mdm1 homologue, putative [Candida dubliniensis CD36]CAX39701.1 structural protein mdm1 homologue, putative [Candida dubliniensis CD36]